MSYARLHDCPSRAFKAIMRSLNFKVLEYHLSRLRLNRLGTGTRAMFDQRNAHVRARDLVGIRRN
jgi:hypothetical protein